MFPTRPARSRSSRARPRHARRRRVVARVPEFAPEARRLHTVVPASSLLPAHTQGPPSLCHEKRSSPGTPSVCLSLPSSSFGPRLSCLAASDCSPSRAHLTLSLSTNRPSSCLPRRRNNNATLQRRGCAALLLPAGAGGPAGACWFGKAHRRSKRAGARLQESAALAAQP